MTFNFKNNSSFTNFATAALATMLFAAPALAVVPNAGDFVPEECGAAQVKDANTNPISQICIGHIAGANGQKQQEAVSFRLADGQQKSFAVVQRFVLANAFENGATQSVLTLRSQDGQQASMKVTRDHNSDIQMLSGQVGEQAYHANQLQPVMVMQ